ncbi:hypothetical protein R1flu_023640 [Riccia fluitans]|uniref:Uncharacterized protein n=1 Tax=Riccia fluitans TaxID=41844 RepID=A0ABD1XSL5_9MARC
MADEATGQRLPTIWLMDEDLYKATTTEQIRRFRSRIQFVPYSFKELKDLDHVKILVMYVLNMLKYVTSLQRHCVPEDIFLWDIMNTNAEDDCLLVKDTRGGTNVIGWNEIAIIFGAKHNKKEDFQSIKRYEETFYYKDAAPYGPMYHLMTIVAELFWSHGRSNRFLILMILAYLCGLHGHNYNWAKAILHDIWSKILFLQSRERSNDGGKTILVGCKLPEEIPIASLEPVDYNAVRKKVDCKRGWKMDQPGSTKRPHAANNEHGLPSTKINKETNDGLREQLAANDAEKSDVHALAQIEVQHDLEEFKRSVTMKEKAAKETHQ